MYLAGNSVSAVGRLLGYTPSAVLDGVKKDVDRSAVPLLRLYARLPPTQQYCSDRYAVYTGWFSLTAGHRAGQDGPVNWNEGYIRYCAAS